MANTKANSDVIADNSVTEAKLANNSVTASKIASNAVGADELNVVGNGTAGQFLSSDGDGSMSWTTQTQGIGVGQTWQNVTASRALATNYTNTTGRPIQVMIQCGNGSTGNSNSTFRLTLNGIQIIAHKQYAGTDVGVASFIVPNGVTYRMDLINPNGAALGTWMELR